MRTILTLTSMTMVLLAITASNAVAQQVPPGNASVDEYTENVPGAGGDTSSENHEGAGGANSSGGGGGLPPEVADQFEEAGSDGEAAAALAETGTPESHANRQDKPDQGDNASGQGDNAGRHNSGEGEGFGTAVGRLVGGSDSGGMGIALPLILVGALAAALLFLIARKRSDGLPDEPSSA